MRPLLLANVGGGSVPLSIAGLFAGLTLTRQVLA